MSKQSSLQQNEEFLSCVSVNTLHTSVNTPVCSGWWSRPTSLRTSSDIKHNKQFASYWWFVW